MKKFVFAELVVILLIVMPTIVEAEDAVKDRGNIHVPSAHKE